MQNIEQYHAKCLPNKHIPPFSPSSLAKHPKHRSNNNFLIFFTKPGKIIVTVNWGNMIKKHGTETLSMFLACSQDKHIVCFHTVYTEVIFNVLNKDTFYVG